MKAKAITRKIKVYSFLFSLSIFFTCSVRQSENINSPIEVDIWYGDHQEFGKLGIPQRWTNILGNVKSANGVKEFSFKLNGRKSESITLGTDLHRLAEKGDFNIDLDIANLMEGENAIEIYAKDSGDFELVKKVMVHYQSNNKWPLPYTINWTDVKNLQEVVQVVDGKWEITENGLHNVDTYYDRVVAFGDENWRNYEVKTTVTFHHFMKPEKGPPNYNVSHAAIATRWPGHDLDDLQPHRNWYPLGATAEFRLTADLDSCRWRIFDGPKSSGEKFYEEQNPSDFRKIQLNKTYGMKHRVETIGNDSTKYSVKLWQLDEPEPKNWDITGIEKNENISSGSVLLIAHHTNVTFGDVEVNPIENEQ